MKTIEKMISGIAVVLGVLFIAVVIYIVVWLMMLYPVKAHADVELVPSPPPAVAALPLELPLAGVVLIEEQFHALARKTLYAQGYDVVSAQGGVVVGMIRRTRWTTDPVNADLQWDDVRKSYVYRVELRLRTDRIMIGFLPSWGGKSDKLLRELRAEVAERLY